MVIKGKRGTKETTNQELGLEVTKTSSKKKKGKEKSKDKDTRSQEEALLKPPGIIPALQTDSDPASLAKAWQTSLILGGYMPRMWEPDPGYFYLDREVQPVPYWLTLNMLRTNLVIVAPQGSGKTSSVYRPMLTFMRRSNSVALFWDSKGDDFDPSFFDYNFDPENPSGSVKLNIFAGQNPAMAGERLAEALIPDLGGDKQYFSNNAKDALAALTAAHNICFERNPELVDLLKYLTTPANVQSLHDTVLENQRGPEHYEEGLRLATLLRRVIQLAENKNTDVLGSLATALSPLVTGSAARVLVTNPQEDAYTIEDLLKEPGLIRLSLPVAKSPRIAPILGRLVLAQFTYAVLSPDCNRNLFKLAAVDEARHFITENVANGMAQARSNNAGFVLSFQTLTQIKDESLLDTIFAVSGTKIVMTGVGEKDARRFSDTFGQLELPYVNHSQGQSQAVSHNSGSSYTRGQEYEFFGGQSGHEARSSRSGSHGRGQTSSHNTSSSMITRVRPRFFQAEIRELNQFQAVIESSDSQGRRWFAQVIDMRASTVNRLENRVLEQLKRLRDAQKKSSGSQKEVDQLADNSKDSTEDTEKKANNEAVAVATAKGNTNNTNQGGGNPSSKNQTQGNATTPAAASEIPVKATVRFLPIFKTIPNPEGEGEKEVKPGQRQGDEVAASDQEESGSSSKLLPIQLEPLSQQDSSGFPAVTQLNPSIEPAGQTQAQTQAQPEPQPLHLPPPPGEGEEEVKVIEPPKADQNQSAREEFIQASFLMLTDSQNLPEVTAGKVSEPKKSLASIEENNLKAVPSGLTTNKDRPGLL